MRRFLASLVACCVVGSAAPAQTATPAKMTWRPGQVISYRVEHATRAVDSVGDSRSETRSVLKVVRRWKVVAVDAAGVATLEMSLASMFQERTTPGGDVLLFDSENPTRSTPALKEAMGKFVGAPLATIRVDALGRVVEVKASLTGASSYENELPFIVQLPAAGLKAGEGWERTYQITLAPPVGTGERYDAVQSFVCKSVKEGQATIAFHTALKTAPRAAADAIPLWQMMPQGEAVFDLKAGRLHAAKLAVSKELKGHQGENSSCTFTSTVSIQVIDR